VTDKQPTFAEYGKSFQEKTMQALLFDHRWSEQMLEVFKPDYFELKYLQYLSTAYFKYANKYKAFPTFSLLITIVRDDLKKGSDKILADQIIDYLSRMKANPDPGDIEFVKDKSLDFCRKQAIKEAMVNAIDLMQTEKYEAIVDVMKKAIVVGTTPSMGHDFFEVTDLQSRFTDIARNPIATGIPELDAPTVLGGGLGMGELGIVIAPTGVGKSHMLTAIGAAALKRGVDVVHYTFELSEHIIGKRYDSHICDIDFNDLVVQKDEVLKTYESNKDEMGRLIIKYYPTGTCSVHTIRSHLERASTKGFAPKLMVIDYPDIMKSSRSFDSLRHELKLIYEELRGFAGEMKIPVWGASQSNKEGSNTEIVDLSNMSEAYGKAMVADVVISISRKSSEKATGGGRLYVAKNRAGRDGILWPIKIDTARSKFTVVGSANSLEEEKYSDENDIKKRLRSKLKEMEENPSLTLRDGR